MAHQLPTQYMEQTAVTISPLISFCFFEKNTGILFKMSWTSPEMQHFLDKHTTHLLSLENSSRQPTCRVEIAHSKRPVWYLAPAQHFSSVQGVADAEERLGLFDPYSLLCRAKESPEHRKMVHRCRERGYRERYPRFKSKPVKRDCLYIESDAQKSAKK